ncbi:hypothetical protein [Nonomuraea sp. SYSU D8015]|uniref:hypothetical protein n=1 Tax=Nonomuraea sp. SYSU D8015 TaxID=2593644 RepID=UPI0016610F50|nr:hypothetical protein [Nonomuraea sp. SYSU D8015]
MSKHTPLRRALVMALAVGSVALTGATMATPALAADINHPGPGPLTAQDASHPGPSTLTVQDVVYPRLDSIK